MLTWIITGILVLFVGLIIYAEIRCGRRAKDFLETISPEIEALNDSVLRKYRAIHGKDPTMPFRVVNFDRK